MKLSKLKLNEKTKNWGFWLHTNPLPDPFTGPPKDPLYWPPINQWEKPAHKIRGEESLQCVCHLEPIPLHLSSYLRNPWSLWQLHVSSQNLSKYWNSDYWITGLGKIGKRLKQQCKNWLCCCCLQIYSITSVFLCQSFFVTNGCDYHFWWSSNIFCAHLL